MIYAPFVKVKQSQVFTFFGYVLLQGIYGEHTFNFLKSGKLMFEMYGNCGNKWCKNSTKTSLLWVLSFWRVYGEEEMKLFFSLTLIVQDFYPKNLTPSWWSSSKPRQGVSSFIIAHIILHNKLLRNGLSRQIYVLKPIEMHQLIKVKIL